MQNALPKEKENFKRSKNHGRKDYERSGYACNRSNRRSGSRQKAYEKGAEKKSLRFLLGKGYRNRLERHRQIEEIRHRERQDPSPPYDRRML